MAMKINSLLSVLCITLTFVFIATACHSPGSQSQAPARAQSAVGGNTNDPSDVEPSAAERLADGDRYLDQRNYDMAIVSYAMAIDQNPNLAQAHRGLAKTYEAIGLDELAQRNHQRAVNLTPASQQAFDTVVTEIPTVPENTPASQSKLLEEIPVVQPAVGGITQITEIEEIPSAREIVRPTPEPVVTPTPAPPVRTATQVKPATSVAPKPVTAPSEQEQAMQRYLQVLAKDRNNIAANHGMAQLLLEAGGAAEAMPFIRRLLQQNKNDSNAWQLMGQAQYAADRYPEAVTSFQNAERLGQLDSTGQLLMVRSLLKVGRTDNALMRLEKMQKDSPTAQVTGLLGSVLLKENQWDRALVMLNQALAKRPDDTLLLNKIGACYIGMYRRSADPDERTKALEAWRKSLEIQPNQPKIDLLVRTLSPEES